MENYNRLELSRAKMHFHKQNKVDQMARIQICMTKNGETDEQAFIGYYAPLRTFFLQGFLRDHVDYEDFDIWLGTLLEQYPTLEGIIEAAQSQGYEVQNLSHEDQLRILLAAGQLTEPNLVERTDLSE